MKNFGALKRSDEKIILIVRSTRLDDLIARFNTKGQAKFYVEHLGADFSDYQREDYRYKKAAEKAEAMLAQHARVQVVDRIFVPNFIFGPKDTVVALGQDGLVANVMKYLDGQPLIGVNPDTERWEGVLLPFTVDDLYHLIPDVLAKKRRLKTVTMAEATLNTGETIRGVNDLFIGPKSHTSARYHLRIGGQSENHSSSGIIVSTGLGSTGWFRSVVAGASGIATAISKRQRFVQADMSFEWDAEHLYFSVREPWPSTTSRADIVFGTITRSEPLVLVSQMPEHGVIFSDGIETDFVRFNAGTEATISLSGKRGYLVE